ncbi:MULTISPECIES: hypothetical protein [unclassified Sulfuricurvum]|uniref:hypothetical protein n=1 Tax=unclassified Sulfuricurvum TaxID=2632390 RepID=UPI0002999EC9|nr:MULTISPECIES: hypothetical protein [unclassified Sulfuricurvum]OHD80320.1 MAG: hypothetical protein A3D90_02940 [Sulfuricurvum sp. RIFCSPHIGHO2_02_FULL_43_9]OHD85121.1 MAG: hypothetical protein A3I60_01715 [Sulfuricurvum sp. RIFCSPLOWO2_02_FULL_43_45]AFV97106.1 hypothetical protein B649_03960 [Candidatus Sulfuricurvum sp. RIFRC-1]OHD88314.1 MAG: hypothetical protein A3G19_07680 [Sulfuricurvum sp. RIFCSPLOWO2_12_FULL_43_24]HBM35376.1 hypothetical protein [Sulfuricurvum sp.]
MTTEQPLNELLRECADSIGGKNFFLTLAETIRTTREGIIVGEKKQINYTNGTMTWNKTLHADNWRLLIESSKVRTKDGNILLPSEDKRHKNILNMIRTLKPLSFTVTPTNTTDGEGFTFNALEVIDEKTTRVSPLFKALFVMPIDLLRKAM